jgi:outer membrane protein assembly factor BamB
MRLHLEIRDAVSRARREGREHLRLCQFDKARRLYDSAHKLAFDVDLEKPREHFVELLTWLEKTNTLEDMRQRRDQVDEVVARLKQIDELRKAGRPEAAFRVFRPLVSDFRLVQFERKYTMPYLVTSTPGGAEVFVNGERVGITPAAIEMNIIGSTKVRVRRDGFTEALEELVPFDPSLDGDIEMVLVKKTTWERDVSGSIEARPLVAGSLLLLATSNATLLALDLDTGEIAWEAKTGLLDRITAAPVVVGDHAHVITVGGVLHRIRLASGRIEEGRLELHGQVSDDPVVEGKTLYVATANRKLAAIRDGRIHYYRDLALAPATRVLYANGSLFVGTAEGEILVHDADSGKELNRLKAPSGSSFFGGIEAHGDLVVAGAEDGSLYAFRPDSKDPVWRYRTAGPITAPPLSYGDILYLPARDGYVHAIDKKGDTKIRYELTGAAVASPAIVDSFLYAIDGRRITAFDAEDEVPWWDYEFTGAFGSPAHLVIGPKVVVVVTSASRVVAFPKDNR